MAKILIVGGLILLLAGLMLWKFPNALKWLGNLPGDFHYQSGNFSFHFPIVTSIILSILLTLFFRLLNR